MPANAYLTIISDEADRLDGINRALLAHLIPGVTVVYPYDRDNCLLIEALNVDPSGFYEFYDTLVEEGVIDPELDFTEITFKLVKAEASK